MSRLYEREIKDFFEVAKIKMAGTTKEAKGKFGKNGAAQASEQTCRILSSAVSMCEQDSLNKFSVSPSKPFVMWGLLQMVTQSV